MKQKSRSPNQRKHPKTRLGLPDLEFSKSAVLNSLRSVDGQRGYGHAIDEFVDWYCSEPRLATLEEAQTEMSIIMSRLNLLHKPEMRGWGALVKQFRDIAVGPVKRLMWLLLGAVALVLLIACGNAANLLLARARSRTHELGLRATLGAQRGRLLRQLLTESLMLCVAAGVMGVGLAYVFLHTLLKARSRRYPAYARRNAGPSCYGLPDADYYADKCPLRYISLVSCYEREPGGVCKMWGNAGNPRGS